MSAPPIVVAVDANGADLGPAEVAAGAALAAQHGLEVLLFGPAAEIGEPAPGVELVDAPVSIAKDPDPARAARANPEASIVQAAQAVADGRAQAMVSGGSTGAALAAGLFNIKRAPGIHRPALAVALPVPGSERPVVLLDVGANTEVRPEHLVQFAHMGAAFAQAVLGIDDPRVGLLSNGEEATRGTPDVLEAGRRLAEAGGLRFAGNVEGTDVLSGAVDVVATDGFTGNVALKLMEGTSKVLIEAIRAQATSSARAKAGGLLLRPALRRLGEQIDPERHGGAYLLGLRGLGVIAHGRFSRRGFHNAIVLAARGAREGVGERTHEALERAGALRSRPAVAEQPAGVED